MGTRSRLLTALVATALLPGCGGGEAEPAAAPTAASYPSESIRFLVPYGAGGPTDLTSRSVGSCLQDKLGETVVVENRPGGSGALATQDLLSSEPDGHTLALVTAGTTVLTPLANDLDYSKDDITPIGVMSEVPSLLAVGKDSPYQDAQAFFEQARAEPGTLTVGVPGASTPQAIELERLASEYDVKTTIVPFDGNAEMTSALLGSNVDAVLINASQDVVQNVEAGAFVPLAVSSEQRLPWLEDTPTLVEAGFPELTLSGSTFGLAGPGGLPDEVASTLEDTLQECLSEPEVREQLGERYVPEEFVGSEGLAEILDQTQEVYEGIL